MTEPLVPRCRSRSRMWMPVAGGFYPFGLRARKADVLLLVGRWAELEEQYRRDLEKAVAAGLRQQEALLLLGRGELHGWCNEHSQAEVSLERAAGIFRVLGDDAGRLRCENGLAVVYINLGMYRDAETLIAASSEQARQLGNTAALCSFLNSHAVLCTMEKQYDRAIAYLKERIVISREREEAGDIASSHMNIAVVCTEEGRYDLALEHNATALDLSHKSGDIVQQEFALYNQAQILRKLGRGDECLGYLQQALAVARHLGDDPTVQVILKDIAKVKQTINDHRDIAEL